MNERAAPPQGGSGEDSMMAFGLLLAVAAGGCWFLWHRYHAEISLVVLAVQHWQMLFIGHFTSRYAVLDQQAVQFDPSTITFKVLYQFCHLVGLFFRIPAAVLIAVLGGLCLVRNAPSRFTRTLTLDGLMKVQSGVFRTTAAFVGRGLKPSGMAVGGPRPLDPALHAKEWIARYARHADGGYHGEAASQELTRQLGPVWTGPDKAAPLVRCLLAAFALHAARERDAALAFLGDFSAAMPLGEARDPAGPATPVAVPPATLGAADVILRRTDLQPHLRVADRHGFTTPALMTVLMEARRRAGVLAPAQFNFIKMIDRRVWYALHSLGFPGETGGQEQPMPNPRIEAAGARDHWAAERAEGRPLHLPSIARAALAIRAAA